MNTIVAKFGGSSLASAQQFQKVAAIVQADPARRYVVASAPGKRDSADTKVTDMLYTCYDKALAGEDFTPALEQIQERFAAIARELGIAFPLAEEIAAIARHLAGTPSREYMASRGEYLNSRLLAAYLGYEFVDAADCIVFLPSGLLDKEATYAAIAQRLAGVEQAVVPGFYGAQADGTVRTFSRGGSDVTGSILARGVQADLYENWTDVSGMLVADPRLVADPQPIAYISYRELRELAYMGASVLHEDAVFPARNAGIPINIRNTNRPDDPGTMIVHQVPDSAQSCPITGIAGSKGFSSILIEKTMMNAEIGFSRKVLQVLEDNALSFEHLPSGIDTMSVFLETAPLNTCRDKVMDGIFRAVEPDTLCIEDGLAVIAVVGRGMVRTKGTAARIFSAIAQADVNIRMLDQGSSELNIILGVSESDYEAAIRAIYQEFFPA
jgi:aspartate kinase